MADSKDELTAERDALRAENENLRGQLAASGVRRPNVAPGKPYLTEGERQELITFGKTSAGAVPLNLHTAAERFPEADLSGATDTARDAADRDRSEATERSALRGLDYVWPSVAPGQIDPEVAGLPGISGPAAEQPKVGHAPAPVVTSGPPQARK